MSLIASLALLALSLTALADPNPVTPPTGTVGGPCQIQWTADPTGTWTETNIQLMTGSNLAMIALTTVATVDTTSKGPTTFNYTCPDVTPNSVIYFYQFSHAAVPADLVWTTRFGIADAAGQLTPPQYQIQPDNKTIPWGIGSLVDPSQAVAPPSYIVGETTGTGSGNGTLPINGTTLSTTSMMTTSMTSTASTSSGMTTSNAPLATLPAPTVAGKSSGAAGTVGPSAAFGAVAVAALLLAVQVAL